MSLFNLGRTAERVGGAVAGVAEVFRPNAEKSAQRAADYAQSAQGQFAAEFAAAERKGWFNALIDGLNRLPRPLMAFGTIWLFYYAMTDPVGFAERMVGLAAVPEPLWWLLGAVVSFYFGARELNYLRARKAPEPGQVRQIVQNIEEIRSLRPDVGGAVADEAELELGQAGNAALEEWRRPTEE